MSQKERYRLLCQSENTIPLFCRDWWLDAVCGEDGWDVVTAEIDGRIAGAFPYHLRSRFGLPCIEMPSLTQFMGPWLSYPAGQKYGSRLSFEKRMVDDLLSKLPGFASLTQRFHYSFTNWLPFYWQGFEQTTRYTYVIEDLRDLDKVWENIDSKQRNIIKKAQKAGITVEETEDLELFLDLNEKTFRRQGMHLPYTRDFVARLDAACRNRGSRKIFVTRDPEGGVHTGLYCVHDEGVMYNLMQGGDPALRMSGANPLAMWQSIKAASRMGLIYDFEGSMIEPIEGFFRSFGAIQKPYFQIRKTNSRLIRIGRFALELFRG